VYAGFREAMAAEIAARNGQDAYSQMLRHLGDVQHYIHEQAFPPPKCLNNLVPWLGTRGPRILRIGSARGPRQLS
jgi:hypothetical protein